MTLTKVKPHRPTAAHRQRTGQHHRHTHHYIKTYWPYMPIVAIVSFGFLINAWLGQAHRTVLGYATSMSVQSLLDGTNSARQSNGLPALTDNTELDQAAQAKANDMAAKNYWSHNTPDGQAPWTFMVAAGYQYQTAGENLAYGFDSAGDTITGWMNSPEHRANVLNTSFHDVGFGFVNIANYQDSGPETLVVAMYGSLPGEQAVAIAPHASSAPQPVASTPAPSPSPAPVTPSTPASQAATSGESPAVATPSAVSSKTPVAEPKQQRISRLQLVANTSSWSVASLALVAGGALLLLGFRHSLAWHKVVVRGERFALHHPVLDIVAMGVLVSSIILSATSGLIK